MSESTEKTRLIKQVKEAGGYGRRLEDQYGVGLLDMVVILPVLPVFFIEAKLVKSNSFEPTPRQAIEMDRINNVKGDAVALLIGIDIDRIGITRATEKVHITDQRVRWYMRDSYTFPEMLRQFWYWGTK